MKYMKWSIWIVPVLYMIVIWVLSSLPHNAIVELPSSSVDRFIKEALHLVEFAILYLLFVLSLFVNRNLTPQLNVFFALIACMYGVVDEVHQYFVPYRSATLIDVIKDVTGVCVAYYFVRKQVRT